MADSTVTRLSAIASQRWGLLTTAQAVRAGLTRNQLTRMTANGVLERVIQGVYRFAGAPELEHELTFATWLALGGAESVADSPPGVVAGGATAAELHKIGDLYPDAREFLVPTRKTTRLTGVRLRVRVLDPDDVTIVDQLPTLTIERTLADLVEQWTDLSLVADAVRDAVQSARLVSPSRLADHLDTAARRRGYRSGAAFAAELFELAGVQPTGTYR